MTTDDERIAYLAGEDPGALDDAERSDLDELKALLSDPAAWTEPDDGLEGAVVAAIAAESAGAAPPSRLRVRSAASPRARWLRPRLVGAAAAAAGIVILATLTIVSDERSPSETLAADLEPTRLAPGAGGRATFTRTDSGWRIELDAPGLPRLDGLRFYQAWLEGEDALVSIGSFNEGEDVVLWAGVSPVDFPRITITEEVADGDPASSGREVLVGPVAHR